MKIDKIFSWKGKKYSAISDDFRESGPEILHVKTRRNAAFAGERAEFIETANLKEIFSIKPKIIGITGTNGKTTTATIIYETLRALGFRAALLGTRGFFIDGKQLKEKGLTTPGILELYADIEAAKDCEFFVMEVSSHAIEQGRIDGLKFALRALTNITQDHLDYHGNIEEYVRVKNSFLSDESLGGVVIVNADEPRAERIPNALTYGIESSANLHAFSYYLSSEIFAEFYLELGDDEVSAALAIPLVGKHNLYNALLAILCVRAATGKFLGEICEQVADFGGVEGRCEIVNKNPLVVVDFAHTPDGMEKIFQSFAGRKIAVVFGAGGDRDRTKRPLMGAVAEKYASKIFVTSDNPRSENPDAIIADIASGIVDFKSLTIESDRKKAIFLALESLATDEVLLILGKGDETYQIIGAQKIAFDDREVVREFFGKK